VVRMALAAAVACTPVTSDHHATWSCSTTTSPAPGALGDRPGKIVGECLEMLVRARGNLATPSWRS
jgi:hypothetical protein